jgi:hypothetical protein
MHAFKDRLAAPIRDRLSQLGYYAVIVEDEPLLRGSFDPETKVSSYIEASDAFVALCTEDNRVPGNTAQNIIDEIGRARIHPRLREVVLILKEPQVTFPSNTNPVWEPLDRNQPEPAFELIRRQLYAWGVVPTTPPRAPALARPLPSGFLDQLFDGAELGDHEEAERRLRELFGQVSKEDQRRVARAVFDYIVDAPAQGNDTHIPAGFLEAIARLDAGLVPMEWIEQLVGSHVVEYRMYAAMILWDLAETVPGIVPIDLVARLAKPTTEDWYVFSPALSAAKQLALTRSSALQILLDLGRSVMAEDRLAAVEALCDLARVNARLVPMHPLQMLSSDSDESVSNMARKLRSVISEIPKKERGSGYRTFNI